MGKKKINRAEEKCLVSEKRRNRAKKPCFLCEDFRSHGKKILSVKIPPSAVIVTFMNVSEPLPWGGL